MSPQSYPLRSLEIEHGSGVNSVAFSPDGAYTVSGCNDGTIHQWRVSDGKKMGTTMHAEGSVSVVAISSDGKWIVSGGLGRKVTVWDAQTQQKAVESTQANAKWVSALDVSPDSTRFANASSDCTANICSLTTGERLVGPLKHNNCVECIAFSPNEDHVATAGVYDCLRIWNSRSGELVAEVPSFPESLVWWRDDRIFASTSSNQGWIDALSGKILLELPRTDDTVTKTHLAVSRNRNSLAGLDNHMLHLWDHATHSWGPTAQLGYNGRTIAISPDGHHLVTGGEDKISIWNLVPENVDHYENGVFMHLSGVIQELWSHGELESTLEILSRDIALNGESHHAFANRALVQARLKKWCNALDDAEKSIGIQPSVIGCIARSIALGGQGKCENSTQAAFDLAFSCCRAEDINYLLLVKSVIIFLAGLHPHAIARTDDLIKFLPNKSFYNVVQAHMSVLLVKYALKSHDYDSAVQLLASAIDPGECSQLPELLTVSLITGWNFRFEFHQQQCEVLFATGRTRDAVITFLQIDLSAEPKSKEEMQWVIDFGARCVDKLNEPGDAASDSAAHRDAATYYSSPLTLTDMLIMRSTVHAKMHRWEAALKDATDAIKLDPSYPRGYEKKHAALHGAGHYDEAIKTLDEMFLKVKKSGRHIRELYKDWMRLPQATKEICNLAKHIQCGFPLVMIDTENGRLCNEQKRLDMFKADSKFNQLVSLKVLQSSNTSINQAVQDYFQYATFSHTWELDPEDEPCYHDIQNEPVYRLSGSPGVVKLQKFCKIIQEEKYRWAWSDTCCIDKTQGATLEESLTSMFRWYEKSSLTVIHLKGVLSDSDLEALVTCLWNTRAWTLQEFFASKVVRFYTDDWKLYLPRENLLNHKQSPLIMQEMVRETSVDAETFRSLRPGSENLREKLRLASTRSATRGEDIAYSLFGIFAVSIPVSYGEERQTALGRLLQEVLTGSGNTTILDWIGTASGFNSCLPAEITVYRKPLPPHLPLPIPDDEMETLLAKLHTHRDSAEKLYDRLFSESLSTPRLVSRRLSLACIVFVLQSVTVPFPAKDGSPASIYRATASALKRVDIKTSDNLTGLVNLVLVYPWFQCLLDSVLPHEDLIADDADSSTLRAPSDSDSLLTRGNPSLCVPQTLRCPPQLDKPTRALRSFARLRQPFGALLLAPCSEREYKRVATDNLIVGRIHKDVTPHDLERKICTLHIL